MMNCYNIYKVQKNGRFIENNINFGDYTMDYLKNIQNNVFNGWESRYLKNAQDKSLANTYKSIICNELQRTNPKVDKIDCALKYFSGNDNTIADKIKGILVDYKNSVKKKFIVLTMTELHKRNYNYDNTQMTISSIEEVFVDIYPLLKENCIPDVFILCVRDFRDFTHFVDFIGNKQLIILKK